VQGEKVARAIDERVRALLTHSIEAAIHLVPGLSGIPVNKEVDRQALKA